MQPISPKDTLEAGRSVNLQTLPARVPRASGGHMRLMGSLAPGVAYAQSVPTQSQEQVKLLESYGLSGQTSAARH